MKLGEELCPRRVEPLYVYRPREPGPRSASASKRGPAQELSTVHTVLLLVPPRILDLVRYS